MTLIGCVVPLSAAMEEVKKKANLVLDFARRL
jgi:hypothetical protein